MFEWGELEAEGKQSLIIGLFKQPCEPRGGKCHFANYLVQVDLNGLI